ncbi:MAG: DUF1156 domain-containing protein [Verrucomicrobiales bacterium]
MSSIYPKKPIEAALPLPEINDASSYDKMPGIGPHPKGIHHWWRGCRCLVRGRCCLPPSSPIPR